jgi:hypothetical protein
MQEDVEKMSKVEKTRLWKEKEFLLKEKELL